MANPTTDIRFPVTNEMRAALGHAAILNDVPVGVAAAALIDLAISIPLGEPSGKDTHIKAFAKSHPELDERRKKRTRKKRRAAV